MMTDRRRLETWDVWVDHDVLRPLGWGYRTGRGLEALAVDELPRVRSLRVDNSDGSRTFYDEVIGPGTRFDSRREWVSLGLGAIPTQRFGLRRAVWDVAMGYVSGYPVREVLRFAWNMSLSERRCERVLRRRGEWIR